MPSLKSIQRSVALSILGAILVVFFCFYKPILHFGMGAAARLILHRQVQCELAYHSIEWKLGRILFSDVILFDLTGQKSAFHLHAEKMDLSLDWSHFPKKLKGHLTVSRPHISFFEQREWNDQKPGWFELTVSAKDGMIEWAGIERARFSYDRFSADQLGRMELNWGDSGLSVEGVREGDFLRVDAKIKQLDVDLLKRLVQFYLPTAWNEIDIQQGMLDGWLHLVSEKGSLKSGSAHLEAAHASFQLADCKVANLDGTLDWDGSLEICAAKGLLRDLIPSVCDGRFRGDCSHLDIHFPLASIEDLNGNFTYNPGMGGKWNFQGIAKTCEKSFSFAWGGRGYFHSQIANWIESQLQVGPTTLFVRGMEESLKRIWSGNCKDLHPEETAFLQGIASLFVPEVLSWNFLNGAFQAEGDLILSGSGIERWNVSRLKAENIELYQDEWQVGWKNLEGKISSNGGEIAISGGSFQIPLPENKVLEASGWEGQGLWKEGVLAPSHFTGWIEGIQSGIELSGALNEWKAKAEIAGKVAGALCLKGNWDSHTLGFSIEKGDLEGVQFSGEGWINKTRSFFLQVDHFHGDIDSISKFWKNGSLTGKIASLKRGFIIDGDFDAWDWSLEAVVEKGCAFGGYNVRLENIHFEIDASPLEFSCYGVEGVLSLPQGKIPFNSPSFRKIEGEWVFDFRLESNTWDLLRLAGHSNGRDVVFDPKRSQMLGSPLHVSLCKLDPNGQIANLEVGLEIPWKSILAASPFFQNFGAMPKVPLDGAAKIQFLYSQEGGCEVNAQGIDLRMQNEPFAFGIKAFEKKGEWSIEHLQLGELDVACSFRKEDESYRIYNGLGKWKKGFEAHFAGRIHPSTRCELKFEKMRIDLEPAGFVTEKMGVPLKGLQGILEGEGHFIYDQGIETDLDFTASQLRAGAIALENKGPLHFYYSSEKGMIFSGIDLQATKPDSDLPWVDCKVELLQYDAIKSLWMMSRSHIHLPADFFTFLPNPPAILKSIDLQNDLDFIADLNWAADFTSFTCSMKEGFIPFQGSVRHLHDLNLFLSDDKCEAAFHYLHQGHLLEVRLNIDSDPQLQGRLTLSDEELPEGLRPLTVDWECRENNQFYIHAIEGVFGGVEASFHAEDPDTNTLIGSARVNFALLSELLPPSVAEVFSELEMGKGYELKGRLAIDKNGPTFKGLLSGKQLELFGYQLRTLLGQVDLGPDQMRIYNVKISDMACILKIDEILLEGKDDKPWTIDMPLLSILELRPSLLQKVGEEAGSISPLVVRDFSLKNFKGLLEDGKTYTAKGELHFINSYKREPTVFDFPADLLSRIVGLDLELFIPVCGTLTYELKDGFFRLLELKDAFSESSRSEFFLVKEGSSPVMDLDGNLKVLVTMKQFVLFKLTEAFLISIDGKLNDPQFHLQKKKRFLGM